MFLKEGEVGDGTEVVEIVGVRARFVEDGVIAADLSDEGSVPGESEGWMVALITGAEGGGRWEGGD